MQSIVPNAARMPIWIRQNLGRERHYPGTAAAVHGHGLHTVCEEARCPNRGECWSRGTATFMLLGDTCTRACGFCSVKTGRPAWNDADEPRRVAQACLDLGLSFVVLTSVNRDDLPDGGAGCFAGTLRELRRRKPDMGVEFLTPDFRNVQSQAAAAFLAAIQDHPLPPHASRRIPHLIWGHNVETVPRLYKEARKGAKYERSLDLLALAARQPGMEAKSALMLGLGETREEVLAVLADLRAAGVQRLSLGQYLRPTLDNLPVARYVPPEEFVEYDSAAREMGFAWVKAGPLVRSSYFAEEEQGEKGNGKRETQIHPVVFSTFPVSRFPFPGNKD
ncbi:MAG: lipoate synthase [bacterium]|nr:MAG: lipoate synthase [bacterium]KAF0148228.1 MAG: lipoate synthase [bacterium]KAF0167723.1 MAG: lipoate synthase [bacterium]TXT20148.1 MAG: lipoate synthase [bacterium]